MSSSESESPSESWLAISKIAGWKYLIKREGGYFSLFDVRWEPGRALEARCSSNLDPDHLPPVMGCNCGFYAYRSREVALEHPHYLNNYSCLAEVRLWGRVLEYDNGYRAQYAELVSVHAVPQQVRKGKFSPYDYVRNYYAVVLNYDAVCEACRTLLFAGARAYRRQGKHLCERCFIARTYAVYTCLEKVLLTPYSVSSKKVAEVTKNVDLEAWWRQWKG